MNTNPMGIVDTAIKLAITAHFGVANKHDGEPYLLHVHRVASNFGGDSIDDQICAAVAWLHDAVEDTDLTLQQIVSTFIRVFSESGTSPMHNGQSIPNLIMEGVDAMTKRKGETNEDYYWRVKRNTHATRVKVCDLLDNFGRNHLVEDDEKRLRMAAKYSLGFDILCRRD